MDIKVIFWNIENFYGTDPARAAQVVEHIRNANPDVVGFSEIKDKAALRSILQNSLQDYDFGITDGRQGIELLAGWRRGTFGQALFTQRREFKADNPHLRPASLLSLKCGPKFLNIAFLHMDSGTKTTDYDNRQDMFEKCWSLKKTFDDLEDDNTHFMIMGDLNTMGRAARAGIPAISGAEEIANLAADASAHGMALLSKNEPATWADVSSSGRLKRSSDLDHAIATTNIAFAPVSPSKQVAVRGWNQMTSDADRLNFVENISDHSSVEVTIVGF